VLLGNASYSIYLMHPLVETVARLGARFFHLPVESAWVGPPLVVVVTLAAILFGVFSYRVIETPLLAYFKHRAGPAPVRSAKSAAVEMV
jgi:peptidoglycan/LPS O-acetylase OafA/YrhL